MVSHCYVRYVSLPDAFFLRVKIWVSFGTIQLEEAKTTNQFGVVQGKRTSKRVGRWFGFGELHPWKLTWHWKITIFNRQYIFKWWVFHCYVSFRWGIIWVVVSTPDLGDDDTIWRSHIFSNGLVKKTPTRLLSSTCLPRYLEFICQYLDTWWSVSNPHVYCLAI